MLTSERQRAVCKAKYLDGVETCREIGERLGLTETQADNFANAAIARWRRMAGRGELDWLFGAGAYK